MGQLGTDDIAARALLDTILCELSVARRDAWEEAVTLYAVSKDGERLVGVQQRPLAVALNDNPYMIEGDRYVICAASTCNRSSGRRRREIGSDYCPIHRYP